MAEKTEVDLTEAVAQGIRQERDQREMFAAGCLFSGILGLVVAIGVAMLTGNGSVGVIAGFLAFLLPWFLSRRRAT